VLKHRRAQYQSGEVNDCPDYLSGPAPFQNSCSIYQFFAGGDRGLVLDAVIQDLLQSSELVKISGEPGSGKTMLSLVLVRQLKNKFNIVRYDHAQVTAELLVQHLMIEFYPLQTRQLIAQLTSSDADATAHRDPQYADLERAIVESGQIKPVLLIVDSCVIDSGSWPVLRRLNSLRVAGKSVFRVLVLAQTRYMPSAETAIGASKSATRQYLLRRLSLAEIHDYLQHHMLLFDFSRRHMFSREMAYFVADRTSGVFSEVNALAHGACTLAGMLNDSEVSMSHLLRAGLPHRPEVKKSRALMFIKKGGLRLAIVVISLVFVLTTLWLTGG